MTGPTITITDGTGDPTVLPLDTGISTVAEEPGRVALGWAGDRLVTLDLDGAPAAWLDDLIREVYDARRRLIARDQLQRAGRLPVMRP